MGGGQGTTPLSLRDVTKRIVLRPEAETAIVAATDWYESRSPGLGVAFVRAIEEALTAIQANPRLYEEVRPPLRRALLRRFPYSIIYREVGEEIVVADCLHWRQHPRRWQSRS